MVAAGVVLTLLGILGRQLPQLVKGLSVWTVLQALGTCLLFYALWRRRGEIRARWKASRIARHLLIILGIGYLFLVILLADGVIMEIREGRFYSLVEAHLERDDPLVARDLVQDLHREVERDKSPPLRVRIVRRIGELGNSAPAVTLALRGRMKAADEDREVRAAATGSFATLMTPRDVVSVIAALPDLEAEAQTLFLEALRTRTGVDYGTDFAKWRRWLGEEWIGVGVAEAFSLAVTTYGKFSAEPLLRKTCLDRIRTGVGADDGDLTGLLEGTDPPLRAAAAAAIGATGGRRKLPALIRALKKETVAGVAEAIARAVLACDPERPPLFSLYDVAKTSRDQAPRAAASRALTEVLDLADEEPGLAALLVGIHRKLPPGVERRSVLEELVRLARDADVARAELLRVARDGTQAPGARATALRGLLGLGENAPTNADLVGFLEGEKDTGFAESIRAELRRRTGKDGGRDPAAWRTILEER